jgi:hypothetical protein
VSDSSPPLPLDSPFPPTIIPSKLPLASKAVPRAWSCLSLRQVEVWLSQVVNYTCFNQLWCMAHAGGTALQAANNHTHVTPNLHNPSTAITPVAPRVTEFTRTQPAIWVPCDSKESGEGPM